MLKPTRIAPLLLAAALLIGGSSGLLFAQDDADSGDDSEVTVPMEKQALLSPAEMREKSSELITAMQAMLTRVVELQGLARKQKDVIKLNCVNDKLLQVKQLLNIAESARTDMVESIAQQSDDGRYHHFGQITIASEKVSSLRDEAEACIGEELIFLGPTQIDVDEPEIPDDPTQDDFLQPPEVEPPAYSSPYV
jgi:hypothetical protein